MAEENKEVVEETAEKVVEKKEQPRNKKGQFTSKFESEGDDSVVKVDLSAPPPVEEEVVENKEEVKEQPKEEAVEETVEEELPVIEEITVEDLKENKEEETVEEVKEVVEEAITESQQTVEPIPENIQKVIQFMNDTGGDLQDYVNLNRDVNKMDDSEVLDEYYRDTKPHLSIEERSFLLEQSYGVNEEEDDDRTARMKKIALKEQVAEARAYLDGQKSKYYEDIKAGSKLTEDQQKAINFFDRYNKDAAKNKQISEAREKEFLNKTNKVFNEDFKGFDYQVGDKKFRFNVKDSSEIKEIQSDPTNFVKKFVDENKNMHDPTGYHKSLFTAMNADKIAQHFYEQGKADAVKNQVAKDKNIDLNPRQTHGETVVGDMKVRVLGESSADMKNRSFRIRKKN